jgi:hypothetical protein
MESKLPFGLKNGHAVHISRVERGLQCGCSCPACKQPLIARKGTKTVHHFAHYHSHECIGAIETILHLAAKEILQKNKKIHLPAVMTSLGYARGQSIDLYPKHILHFEKVFLEKRIDKIIPDIIIHVKGRQLIIEITVTHSIDRIKMNRIRKLNISTLEIDLRKQDQQLTINMLEKLLIYDLACKKWVYNAKREDFVNEIMNLGKELPLYHRTVYGCPLKINELNESKSADLINCCFNCDFLIHANGERSNSKKHITCVGHEAKENKDIINRYKR